jgi:hypothetical protein
MNNDKPAEVGSPHTARRRYGLGYLIFKISELQRKLAKLEKNSLYLIGFSKNLASHFDRSPLNHSYGYASAGDRPNCFASFSLNSDPFMQYAG